MSSLRKSAWLALVISMFSVAAHAFELDGAWTTDQSQCSKVFMKRNHAIVLAPKSDLFGGGFIVEGKRIRGKLYTCDIVDRKQEGAVLHLLARCSTSIALLSPTEFNLKIEDDDHIKRTLADFQMAVPYARCAFSN